MPSVSVIIPSYNCATLLTKAVESALAQTYTDLEIIVVDDGSTDDTALVIAPYLDRVQYVRQTNKGLPGARNAGILRARGEFIALLDADDFWLPTKLSAQMGRFADPEVTIVYSDFAVEYADGRTKASYLAERPLASEGWVLDPYIQSRFLFPSTMILRKDAMQACGLFDEEMMACEDIELFARMCFRGKVAWVREVLMVRTESGVGITGNLDKMSRYTILALQKILAREPHLGAATRKIIQRELAQQLRWRAYREFKAGSFREARKNILESIRRDPWRLRRAGTMLPMLCLPDAVLRALMKERKAGAVR